MTLTEIDILDEPDALAEAEQDSYAEETYVPMCEGCGKSTIALDGYGLCLDCRDTDEGVFEDFGDESDPSPICNCGTCSDGDYTCIRKD